MDRSDPNSSSIAWASFLLVSCVLTPINSDLVLMYSCHAALEHRHLFAAGETPRRPKVDRRAVCPSAPPYQTSRRIRVDNGEKSGSVKLDVSLLTSAEGMSSRRVGSRKIPKTNSPASAPTTTTTPKSRLKPLFTPASSYGRNVLFSCGSSFRLTCRRPERGHRPGNQDKCPYPNPRYQRALHRAQHDKVLIRTDRSGDV